MNDFKELLINTREKLFDFKFISYDVMLMNKSIIKAYHIERGYESLHDNYLCATTMLRLHLENLFRLWEALIVDSANYLTRYIKNRKIERLCTPDGRKLTMGTLAMSLGKAIHQMELYDIYNIACDFLHSSSFKYFVCTKGNDIIISNFKSKIGSEDDWKNLNFYMNIVYKSYEAVFNLYLTQLEQFSKVDNVSVEPTDETKEEVIKNLSNFLNTIAI